MDQTFMHATRIPAMNPEKARSSNRLEALTRIVREVDSAPDLDTVRIELPDGIGNVASLTKWLQARSTVWNDGLAGSRLRVAVNQTVVNSSAPVHDGDEVAWFPPVTGG